MGDSRLMELAEIRTHRPPAGGESNRRPSWISLRAPTFPRATLPTALSGESGCHERTERAMGRRWLAVVVATLVAGAYAGQVVVPAAETSPAPILGIAP